MLEILYIALVKPIMVLGTLFKSYCDKSNKLQTQAAQITGIMKPIKISYIKNITELELVKDRCDISILQQVEKNKKLTRLF